MVMTKQELAQKRNYFKYVLTGMAKPIDIEVLTGPEVFAWNQIKAHIKTALDEFDKNSKELGLNVPDKCWCGKPAKYEPIGYPDYMSSKVCKKHINYE